MTILGRPYLVLRLALIGGVVAIVGDPLIRHTMRYVLHFVIGWPLETPGAPPGPTLPSVTGVLLDFLAGFLAVHVIAPFALRRARGEPDGRRWRMGIGYGALCGLVTCLLLAFLHLTLSFVGPVLLRDGWSGTEMGLRLYTTYLRISLELFGVPAALIGAIAGRVIAGRLSPAQIEQGTAH